MGLPPLTSSGDGLLLLLLLLLLLFACLFTAEEAIGRGSEAITLTLVNWSVIDCQLALIPSKVIQLST